MADLYDVDAALREIARNRQRTDALTHSTADLADRLASRMVEHFGPEGRETAGLAIVLVAASLAGLINEAPDLTPGALANLLAFAGQRMVMDARAADEAVTHA